jgi:hypothetical protein
LIRLHPTSTPASCLQHRNTVVRVKHEQKQQKAFACVKATKARQNNSTRRRAQVVCAKGITVV